MLFAAGSGTRREPRVGSCSRVLSEDVEYCIGLRRTAQYPVGRVPGGVDGAVDELVLQCSEERLGHGISVS